MRYRLNEDVLWKVVDSEAVIVQPGKDEYCFLNPSGTDIWLLIDEGKNLEEILEELLEKYDVSLPELKPEVEAVIAELKGKGLIEAGES